jgi:thymidylate synthase (FAD)
MSKVKLISFTYDAENIIAYCARVSSSNQDNPEIAGLLKYMIREGHWSPFEMANMVLEINTSRAISPQILRHRSFSFQEFSQRYSSPADLDFYTLHARRQDEKNRQNSIADMSTKDNLWFIGAQANVIQKSAILYQEALDRGIAKEVARFLLPESTMTKIYMNGTIRSWIHYIDLRTGNGTQKEHMDIANECKEIFVQQFPIISEALGWSAIA